ncbi:MAG: 5-formyltetrahydrofolate cyclo-ligase [Methylococcales bacterium]
MSHVLDLKKELRQKGYKVRACQRDKDKLSGKICERFIGQPEYQRAKVVMWYLHCRSEVRTSSVVEAALQDEKTLVVPYCTKDEDGNNKLGLWRLESFEELVPGTWDILEPPRNRWAELNKEIGPSALDMVLVPGVAFDRDGGRLGNGAGYYDRLMSQVRADTLLVAASYESQLFPRIPMVPYDVFMDKVITEKAVYTGRGRV